MRQLLDVSILRGDAVVACHQFIPNGVLGYLVDPVQPLYPQLLLGRVCFKLHHPLLQYNVTFRFECRPIFRVTVVIAVPGFQCVTTTTTTNTTSTTTTTNNSTTTKTKE